MKKIMLAASAALLPVAGMALVALPVQAQVNDGLATLNIDRAVQSTNAYRTAAQQIRTANAQLIQQIETRQNALNAEIGGMVQRLQAAAGQPNANQQALQQQYNQIEARQESAQNELERMQAPLSRAQAYVEEQIGRQLQTAVVNVMNATRTQMLINPQAVIRIASPQADLTDRVTAELNKLVPSVSATPPANWQPGQADQAAAPAAPVDRNGRPQGR